MQPIAAPGESDPLRADEALGTEAPADDSHEPEAEAPEAEEPAAEEPETDEPADEEPETEESVWDDSMRIPVPTGLAKGTMELETPAEISDAPSSSLLLQVQQARAENRRRLMIGGVALLVIVLAAVVLPKAFSGSDSPADEASSTDEETEEVAEVEEEDVSTEPEEVGLTPEQLARQAENMGLAVRTSSRYVRAGLEAGYSEAVTHLSVEQVAVLRQQELDERRSDNDRSAPTPIREHAEDTAPPTEEEPVVGDNGDTVAVNTEPTFQNDGTLSVPTGLGPAPTTDRGQSAQSSGPGAEHFTDGMRGFVRDSIERCNQRQISEEGALEQSRITLSITVNPSGRVSDVDIDRDLRNTAFARCLQSHSGRWLFDRFDGDAVTLERTYVVAN